MQNWNNTEQMKESYKKFRIYFEMGQNRVWMISESVNVAERSGKDFSVWVNLTLDGHGG